MDASAMSFAQMVGHRLLVGLPGPTLDTQCAQLIQEYRISNFILMPRNIENKTQLAALCGSLQQLVQQETGHPALIAIDQEGGTVTRMPPDACNVPGAMALAATGRPQLARQAGRLTAQELVAMGVNFDLAPVLDINSNPRNPVIGERSYGDTVETVIQYGLAMLEGLAEGGTLACAKHFPGHGDTQTDSHLAVPVIGKTLDALRENELKPFAAAISAGVDSIMSAHIRMPALEPDEVPNTLSRRVMTGLLRDEMGFKGLVVSDCLEMNAISETVGTPRGALLAAAAGVDLLCICHTPQRMKDAAELLRQAAENGELDRGEMEQSVQRILAYKEKAATRAAAAGASLEQVGSAAHRSAVEEMYRAAVCLVHAPKPGLPALGSTPFFVGCYSYRTTIASSPEDKQLAFPAWMANKLGGSSFVTGINPSEDEIGQALAMAEQCSCIVAASYNGLAQPGQQQMVQRLAQAGVPMVHIALRTPYDLGFSPSTVWKLAAFEYSESTFSVLQAILEGKLAPQGKLGVHLPAL